MRMQDFLAWLLFWIILISIILALMFGMWFLFGFSNPTSGNHTGIITAVETNGIFFKTDTVYLKTSVYSSQEDKYCVRDKNIYIQLQKLSNNAIPVTVHYHAPFYLLPYKCEEGTGNIIIDKVIIDK